MKTWIPLVGCLALSFVSPATSSADGDTPSTRNQFIRLKATRNIHSELPSVSSPGGCARLYRMTWVRALVRPSERRAGAEACAFDAATVRSAAVPAATGDMHLNAVERAEARGLTRALADANGPGDRRRGDSVARDEKAGRDSIIEEARSEEASASAGSPPSAPSTVDPMDSGEPIASSPASIPELH